MALTRYYANLKRYIHPGKVLIIFGPRQVGKTTLVQNFLEAYGGKYRAVTGDNIRIRNLFAAEVLEELLGFVEDLDLLFIDEAQMIPSVGLGLKMLIDHKPDLKVIVTGSSSFELNGQVGEPLTGRKTTLTLYPLAQLELRQALSSYQLKENLSEYLIYGGYPEIITASKKTTKQELLQDLVDSYLLKDILALDRLRYPKVLLDLLRLLAYQVGGTVSHNELGQQLGIDNKTVTRYLDLLEKGFVLYNMRGFSKNLRNSMTKKSKYYFYDLGVRNAILANFNALEVRNDVGALWENFIVMERVKRQAYLQELTNFYFWQGWDKSEIDLIEERGGVIMPNEMKYTKDRVKTPNAWQEAYPETALQVWNKTNYLEYVL